MNKPIVLTREQAKAKEAEIRAERLDKSAESGIIENEEISYSNNYNVPDGLLDSEDFKGKFKQMSDDPEIQKQYYEIARAMLEHRSGSNGEDLYYHNAKTGKWYKSTEGKEASTPEYNNEIKLGLAESNRGEIVSFHNHPRSTPPSVDDLNAACENGYYKGYVFCHNGRIFEYTAPSEKIDEKLYWRTLKAYLVNGFDAIQARSKALDDLQLIGGYRFKEV